MSFGRDTDPMGVGQLRGDRLEGPVGEGTALDDITGYHSLDDGYLAEFDPDDVESLRPFVVNLSRGHFSTDGEMQTSEADVDAIFDLHLPAFIESSVARFGAAPVPLVIWAHGGIVSERRGLAIAAHQVPWWLGNGAYPLHFVWETGFIDTVRQMVAIADAGQQVSAAETGSALETLDGGFAAQLWAAVKASAALASAPGGGARYLADRLAQFCAVHPGAISVHAAGHSAGAIFHSHFIPAARQQGTPAFGSLQLLAPALRVDGFRSQLLPLIGPDIDRLAIFAMTTRAEEDDTCFQVYRRSLLYLVSRVFEPDGDAPILGLEESIRSDADLVAAFGLRSGVRRRAEIIFSPTGEDAPPDSRSSATSHGGFDNDADTMNSVARRIVGRRRIVEFPAGGRSAAAELQTRVEARER